MGKLGLLALVVMPLAIHSGFAQRAATLTTLANEFSPSAAPVIGKHGILYGTSYSSVYELKPPSSPGGAWQASDLYDFPGGGVGEQAPLVIGAGGELYGTTYDGGAPGSCPDSAGCGTVFVLTPPSTPGGAWTQSTLYNFKDGSDGGYPQAGLTVGPEGTLYGTTVGGGSTACESGCGTVFKLTPPSLPGGAWTESVLYSFAGLPGDGERPYVALAMAGDGTLYGTTGLGGAGTACPGGCGVVFGLTPPTASGGAWTETVVYNFTGGSDGGGPGVVITGSDGNLYGTTFLGGAKGRGTLYQLTPPAVPGGFWAETVLLNFGSAAGLSPSGLVAGPNGVLYGTAESGGLKCGFKQLCGLVFKMTPPSVAGNPWTETVLHKFDRSQGYHPLGGVAMGANGTLYGTTSLGGADGQGTVYKLVP